MTEQQVNILIHTIKAYFPTLKILDNPIDVVIWESEFANYDNDIVLEATRQVCREEENGLKVNIASIKKRVAELEEENKRKMYFINQQKENEERLNYRPSEYTRNKLKETLAKFGVNVEGGVKNE